ncbi:MAG TPA: SdrD B-like domain-containing protein [Humisphaera sp.]|nr:SdrD B-like domain-containing protein [Humisphaera sp.]
MTEALEARICLSAGDLDTSFGTAGIAVAPILGNSASNANAVVVQSDGKELVGGWAVVGGWRRFAVTRLNTNGSVDTTFGTAGTASVAVGVFSQATAIALQSDGRIVVAGTTDVGLGTTDTKGHTSNQDFAVARLNSNGTIDTSFNTTGSITIDFNANQDSVAGVRIQSDGKIVVAGSADAGPGDDTSLFAVARLNSNGTLDTTFGTGGKVTTDIDTGTDNGYGVRLDSSGRIVVAGTSSAAGSTVQMISMVRYKTNGALDTTFGTGGKVLTQSPTVYGAGGKALFIQSNGQLLVVGQDSTIDQFQRIKDSIIVARYSSNGVLDSTFGSAGIAETNISQFALTTTSAALTSDGHILVAGLTGSGTSTNSFLVRLTSAGGLDTSFGSSGVAASQPSTLAWLAQTSGGAIIGVGMQFQFSGPEYQISLVLRYTAAGAFDTTFAGVGHETLIPQVPVTAFSLDAAIQPDGKIITVGAADRLLGTGSDFLMSRWNANGSLDTTFATNGNFLADESNRLDRLFSVLVQPDGKILAEGTSNVSGSSITYIFRVNSNGTLDSTFGSGGAVTLSNGIGGLTDAMIRLADGKLLLYNGGQDLGFPGNSTITVERLLATGAVDTTFGQSGITSMHFSGYATLVGFGVDSQGRIVVSGYADSLPGAANQDAIVARFTPDGSPDPTFGNGGFVSTAWEHDIIVNAMAIQPDDKILLSGYVRDNGAPAFYNALSRYNVDGSLDASFGNAGRVVAHFSPTSTTRGVLAVDASGKILMASGLWLERFTNAGLPDPTFGSLGVATFGSSLAGNANRLFVVPASNRYIMVGGLSRGTGYENDPAAGALLSGQNPVPIVSAGGPYSLNEGSAITLAGSATPASGTTISKYEWDFNYQGDPLTFNATSVGQTPSFSAAGLAGSTRLVALRVTDSTGRQNVAAANLTILVVPPVVSASGLPAGWTGISYNLNLSSTSPGGLTVYEWSVDWGDGSGVSTVGGSSPTGQHTYRTASGPAGFTIKASAHDNDGAFPAAPVLAHIYAAPTDNFGTITLQGSAGNDAASFSTNNGQLTVTFDDAPVLTYGIRQSLVYFPNGGNDSIFVSGGTPLTLNMDDGTHTLTVAAGSNATVNFGSSNGDLTINGNGNTLLVLGTGNPQFQFASVVPADASIAGIVFNDENANGRHDAGEQGLAGRSIFVDLNENGRFDALEPSAITMADGSYTIGGLVPGDYLVRETSVTGWRATTASTYQVALAVGQTIANKNFGQTNLGRVSGFVFDDRNSNGKRGDGEPLLAARVVYIDANNNGKVDANERRTLTGPDGRFSFDGLAAGNYVIREVAPAGWANVPGEDHVAVKLKPAVVLTGVALGQKKGGH